jgi:pyruvate dehydrogenase complex dehydrogenase (E1) component
MISDRAQEIAAKLHETRQRSLQFQATVRSRRTREIISESLVQAHDLYAEAKESEPRISTVLLDSAHTKHSIAQDAAKQQLLETLADEIYTRYIEFLEVQIKIFDHGGEDKDRLLKMSEDWWEMFLEEKRRCYGAKYVKDAIELAAL